MPESPVGSRGRLLVIAGEPLSTLLAKGFSVEYLNSYYNPAGLFAAVGMLNVFQELPIEGLKHAFIQVPANAALDAWRDSNRDPWQYDSLDGAELRRFFQACRMDGFPQPGTSAWIAFEATTRAGPACSRSSLRTRSTSRRWSASTTRWVSAARY